jgi:integrase
MAKFTAKFVENLKPGPARREIPDPGCSNLYLVLQPSGARSWAARYRDNGRSVKLTLGSWPQISLHDARVAAAEALKQVKLGQDPAKARQDAKIKADAAKADTLTAICEKYLGRPETKRLRTHDQRVSILKRQIYPLLGSRPIGEIKRREIAGLLDKIEDKSGPRAADVALAILRRIFNWQAVRDDDFISPIVRGMNRQKPAEHRRARILNDDEIRAVWAATEDNTAFSSLIRFLLLTTARRNEAAAMTRDEIDADGVWRLPASRSKTKVEVVRPLSKAALALIEQIPQIDDCPFIFSTTGRTPISQFSIPKAKLDAASGTSGWTIHDLRRTARSLLSRAGVNSDVAEKALGHSRGDDIERYDRHDFRDEMRHAFERLSALIETIAHPPEGKLIQMPTRR